MRRDFSELRTFMSVPRSVRRLIGSALQPVNAPNRPRGAIAFVSQPAPNTSSHLARSELTASPSCAGIESEHLPAAAGRPCALWQIRWVFDLFRGKARARRLRNLY